MPERKTRSKQDIFGLGILKTEAVKSAFYINALDLRTIKDKGRDKEIWFAACEVEDGTPFQLRFGRNGGRDTEFEAMRAEIAEGFSIGPVILQKLDTGNPLNPMWSIVDAQEND